MTKIISKNEKKIRLFKQLIGKVITEQTLDSNFKKFLSEPMFLDLYFDIFNNINRKMAEEQPITEEFIVEFFGVVGENTDKTQHEIVEQLDDIYFMESLNAALKKFEEDKVLGVNNSYKDLVTTMNKVRMKLEKINVLSLHDDTAMENIFDKMVDKSNRIFFGMEGFDDLTPERGQLVSYLGATGKGKSWILQKLTARALQKGYKVAHFTLELSDVLFTKRLIASLGWFPAKLLDRCSKQQFMSFKNRLKKFNEPYVVTVEKGRINLAKIEKVLATYRPDVVFIDNVQKIKEEFDPNSSKASPTEVLNELAIKYDCLIVISIQTNDEGRKVEDAPDLTHIGKMKAIADDCTFVIGFRSRKSEANPKKVIMEFVTRKHRNDYWINYSYICNLNVGEWELQTIDSNQATSGSCLLGSQDYDIQKMEEEEYNNKLLEEIEKNNENIEELSF